MVWQKVSPFALCILRLLIESIARVIREAPMRLITILLLMISVNAFAGVDTAIRVELEEPAKGGTYTGISNMRGWSVAPSGIASVEVYINGSFLSEIPMGGARGDVGNAFPDYPDSNSSGFSGAFNYKNLQPGEHTVTVRAYDYSGNYNEATNVFYTKRFVTPFIGDRTDVDLGSTQTVSLVDAQTFVLGGPTVEGIQWDILLSWDTATQGFEIIDMREFVGSSSPPPSPPAQTGEIVSSNVVGFFEGWTGNTTVELQNGQVWQQTDYNIEYVTFASPYIVIYSEPRCGSGWRAFFPEEFFPPKGTCVTRVVRLTE